MEIKIHWDAAAFRRETMRLMDNMVHEAVGRARCPDHPSERMRAEKTGSKDWIITGCCEKGIEAANRETGAKPI